MKGDGIQYIGANQLSASQRAVLDKLSTGYQSKVSRMLKNMTYVIIHIKAHETAGKAKKRKKYSVHIRAIAPTRIFTSTKAHDWDLTRTIHKSFADLMGIISKSLKTDEQRPKRVNKATLRNL